MSQETGSDAVVVPTGPFQEVAGKAACAAAEVVRDGVVATGDFVKEGKIYHMDRFSFKL